MSAIRKELMEAAAITQKRGESDADFLVRLNVAISSEITEDQWNKLSEKAQDWNNDASDAITAGKSLPSFPDEEVAPASTSRRRGAAADPAPEAPAKYEPKVGEDVVFTSARGKVSEGIVVEVGADGVIIINKGGEKGDQADDVECDLEKGTMALVVKQEPTSTSRRRGSGSGDAAPATKKDPEVGDTIEVVTARDKVIVGNVEVLDKDDLVIKDAAGTEHELTRSKLKSLIVKVDNSKGGAAPAASGRRGSAAAPAAEEKGKRSSNPAGVSVGQRINEMVVDDPKATVEAIDAALKKEGLDFRENTLKMTYAAAHKFLEILRSRKIIK